jgi:hypothetical protein
MLAINWCRIFCLPVYYPKIELNYQYSSPNIVLAIKLRRIRWAEHVAHMGERRGVYRVLVGKPERKRPMQIIMVTSIN